MHRPYRQHHAFFVVSREKKGNTVPNHRKSLERHILTGSYRRDRHASRAAVTPAPGIAEPPAWLSAESAAEFRRLAGELGISPTYSVALALLSDAVCDYRRASEATTAEPLTVTDAAGNVKAHPAHRAKAATWGRLMAAAREFGLSPRAAEHVTVSTPAPTAPRTVADFRLTK